MCAICEALGRSAADTAATHAFAAGGGDTPVPEAETYPGGVTAPNGKPVDTLDQAIAALTRSGTRWTPGSTVKFSFYDTAPVGLPADVAFAPVTEVEKSFARQGFAAISDVANINFAETPSNGLYGREAGGINFYQNTAAPDYVWGSTVRYTGGLLTIRTAEIEISSTAVGTRRWFVGGYNYLATIHEILHAVGFSHPGDYNANGSAITYVKDANYYQDSRQYTAMSYFDPSSTGANFVPPTETAAYSLATLGLHDIAAAQKLYGANTTTRTGDTVYGFNSNTGVEAYDATINTHPAYAIWDAGGVDTLDFSGTSYASRIDLREGEFSDVMGMKGNVAIAYGAVIENAIGGSGADALTGNATANVLRGGGGDDVLVGLGGDDLLDGGEGADTAFYYGASADYDWFRNADGSWTVIDGRLGGVDGTDRLVSIEKLTFTDRSVDLKEPSASELVAQAYQNLLRNAPAGADAVFVSVLQADVAAGRTTVDAAYKQIAARALPTTSVATLSYEFFTGATPSKAGLDYLVSTTGGNANNLNSAYYQTFSTENRFINFSVNLGKLGEGNARFSSSYGALTLFDATRAAYKTIFGAAPTDDKIHAILDPVFDSGGRTLSRAEYFAYYGQDGANGLGTKAAMVGWLLGEAAKADIGSYARANDAFLLDLADGARNHVDLVGVYGGAATTGSGLGG